MTDIPMLQVGEINGVRFVAVPYEWVIEVSEYMNRETVKNIRPDDPRLLQMKADDNAEHAGERFPELTRVDHPSGLYTKWYDADSDEVIFTPHGYRKRKDIEHELRR